PSYHRHSVTTGWSGSAAEPGSADGTSVRTRTTSSEISNGQPPHGPTSMTPSGSWVDPSHRWMPSAPSAGDEASRGGPSRADPVGCQATPLARTDPSAE